MPVDPYEYRGNSKPPNYWGWCMSGDGQEENDDYDPCVKRAMIHLTLFRPGGGVYARGRYCLRHADAVLTQWLTQNRTHVDEGYPERVLGILIEASDTYSVKKLADTPPEEKEDE